MKTKIMALKEIMSDGYNSITLAPQSKDVAVLIVNTREQWGDSPEDFEEVEVLFAISKKEAASIVDGLNDFINS